MTIEQCCRWSLRKQMEYDVELHFANDTKDGLLDGLQQDNKEE
jgi:hypothetical protein